MKGRNIGRLLTKFLRARWDSLNLPDQGLDVVLLTGRVGEVAEAVPFVESCDGLDGFPFFRGQVGQSTQKLQVCCISGFDDSLSLQTFQHLTVYLNRKRQLR